MNTTTGTVIIAEDGEYFLTLFAFMASINGNAIQCHLIQKSGSKETYLGELEKYVRNWDPTTDRDEWEGSTHTITVIANLKKGDEVYVKVKTYGNSALLGKLHRRISFSGFLLK